MEANTKVVLAFIAGFIVAKNEQEVRKLLLPYLGMSEQKLRSGYSSLIRFFLEQRELVEDLLSGIEPTAPSPVENLEARKRASR